jgi:hypothetical protein
MMDRRRRTVNTLLLNYRNPTALMCLFKPPAYPYLAVSSHSFTTDSRVTLTPSITLLPPPPLSLAMILAFQLPASLTELLVDRREGKVKGLRLNRNEISCRDIDQHLSVERLTAINQFRLSLSSALSSPLCHRQISVDVLGSSELQESLAALLTPPSAAASDTAAPSAQPAQVQEVSAEAVDPDDLVWERITPGRLVGGIAASSVYYPELRCSLLGSEPYSTSPSYSKPSATALSPPIEYSETVATKLLLEKFGRVGSDEESEDEELGCAGELDPLLSATGWVVSRKKARTVKKMETSEPTNGQAGRSEATATTDDAWEKPTSAKGSDESGSREKQPGQKQRAEVPPRNVSLPSLITAKLEQEIVRHLQRNNNMEFLSELRVQRRIRHICSLIRTTLNVPFFLQRPSVFQVREVEEGREEADAATEGREFLIVLDQSKWREVDSEEEEPVLPPSMRLLRKSRRVASSRPPVVTAATQTENSAKSRPVSAGSQAASKETKSSPSKPLTATKAVKLVDAKSSTPHTAYIVEDKKKTEPAKKSEPAKTHSAAKSTHTEPSEQAKAVSKESSKKTATASSKKKGPQPGTDDHLALYMHDYIKKRGGEVRLAVLRKEAFPEYYDRHSNQRWGGYRYLRKAFLLDYREYFEIFEDSKDKVLYVRALEEKQETKASAATTTSTHESKQEKKAAKQAKEKESSKKAVEVVVKSSKSSSTSETHVVKEKPPQTTASKSGKAQAVAGNGEKQAKDTSSGNNNSGGKPEVHFVHVPSPSRRSQEPVAAASESEQPPATQATPSRGLSQATPSPGLSQARPKTSSTQQAGPHPPSAGPEPQPERTVQTGASDRASPVVGGTVPVVTPPTHTAGAVPVVHRQLSPAVISLTAGQPQFPVMAAVRPGPPPTGDPTAPAQPRPAVQPQPQSPQPAEVEDEWHSSEESWLSEEEFEAAQGSREDIARYLHNYLSTHSFPFGCTISELDRQYQSDYKRRVRHTKVAKITLDLLKKYSNLFRLREEQFMKLREGSDHLESNTFKGRPYTPEHINDYFSRYLGREGVICSMSEAQDVFERSYKKEYKMPPTPLIWFLSDNFFKRSFHQFTLFTDMVVFEADDT